MITMLTRDEEKEVIAEVMRTLSTHRLSLYAEDMGISLSGLYNAGCSTNDARLGPDRLSAFAKMLKNWKRELEECITALDEAARNAQPLRGAE
jgi:hypothetical protein